MVDQVLCKGKVTKKDIEGLEGIESKLIPSELIIDKFFKDEYQAIVDKEAKTEEVKAQMESSCLQDNLCYCDNILGKFFRRDFE